MAAETFTASGRGDCISAPRRTVPAWRRGSRAVAVAAASALLVAGVMFASSGLLNQDELLYVLMIDAAREGRLVLQNGMELFASDRLRPVFVRDGPAGLAPQYPAGYAFLALPFHAAGGIQGLMAMNALAFAATLAALYGLARRLGLAARTAACAAAIFALATFAPTYAFAIWPHASATLAVCASALATVASAQDGQARGRALVLALAGGLVAGVGVNLRADTILLAPAVMLWLATNRALWANGLAYAAGLVPGIVTAAWFNAAKFETWSPLSYGSDSGSTSLAAYWPLGTAAAVAGVLAAALSHPGIRRLCTPRAIATLAAVVLVAALTQADSRAFVLRLAEGTYLLTINFQAYPPASPLFSIDEGGNLLFHGALKRSLLESLPWLGLAPLLYLVFRGRPGPRGTGLLAMAIGIWISVFALHRWHGGSPPHMRYFLSVLPFVAIFAAMALERAVHDARVRLRRLGPALLAVNLAAAGTAAMVFGAVLLQDATARALATRTTLSLAAAVAVLSVLVVLFSTRKRGTVAGKGAARTVAARLTLFVGTAAMTWAGTSALVYDFTWTQLMRAQTEQRNAAAATLRDRTLAVTRIGAQFLPQFRRPDSFVATVDGTVDGRDRDLIDFHLAAGRRVYVNGPDLAEEIAAVGAYGIHDLDGEQYGHLREIRAKAAVAATAGAGSTTGTAMPRDGEQP